MRPRYFAAIAAVLLLALTGCAAGAPAESNDAPSEEPAAAAERAEESAPLVAESSEVSDADAAFLEYVRTELALLPSTGIGDASDDQLIAAGHDACDQLLDGVAHEDVRVVDDETPANGGYYMDSLTVRAGAEQYFCPETLG